MYYNTIQNALFILNIFGGDPRKSYNKLQCFLYFFNMTCAFGMVALLILKFTNTNERVTVINVTDAVTCLFLFCHGMLKSTTMFVKKLNAQELLNKMEQHFWKQDHLKDSSIHTEIQKIYGVARNTHHFIFTLHFFNAMGFLIGPLLTKDTILPFDCFRPEWSGYYILLLFEDVTSIISILCPVLSMDIFFMSIITLTQIQWNMLNNEMTSLFDVMSGKNGIFDDEINQKVRRCIRHHNFLLEYGELINETFSTSLFFFVVIIVLSMCVEMYVATTMSDWQTLRKALVYTATGCIEFMLCYCYPCQNLMDEAARISSSIYFSDWYKHPKYSKATHLILMRGQKTVIIRAGRFMTMDLQTGLATLKTMVSYAMFLRTMSTVDN